MAPRRVAIGSVVSGKYRLIERLGGGGMGEVYRAEHQLAGRIVALKLLRSEFAEDDELTRRFFQEAQAVNRIRHPNIVDVLDAGFSEEGPYVAMECLEGTSLSGALVRAERLDLVTTLSVILPMLDALDAAHRHGIVHRDLKPENVFLARMGDSGQGSSGRRGKESSEVRVKLVDFGIAKVTGMSAGPSPRTHTGVIFGTPDYLSPEQASGEGIIDGRSDVFAVGIVLFELLTGRRPFESKSAVATAYRIVHEPAPSLASMGVKADPLLQTALDIALSKQMGDRFATAVSFADMLAPLVPDGATRREALRSLLDLAVGVQPTVAAPEVGGDASPSARTAMAQPEKDRVREGVADTEAPPPPTGEEAPSQRIETHYEAPDSVSIAIGRDSRDAPPPAASSSSSLRDAPSPRAQRAASPMAQTLQSQDFARTTHPTADDTGRRSAAAPAWPKERPPERVVERSDRGSAPKLPVLAPATATATAPPHSPHAPHAPSTPSASRLVAAPSVTPHDALTSTSNPRLSAAAVPSGGGGAGAGPPTTALHAPPTPLARTSPRGGLPAATPFRAPSGIFPPNESTNRSGRTLLPSTPNAHGQHTASKPRGTYVPRLLPTHVRGKCHTRGTLPRALYRWIERAYGAAARSEVLALLPSDVAETFRSDSYNALVWYDLETTDSLIEATTATLMGGDVAPWRELARENFDQDLGPILRPGRLTDPVQLMKRSPAGWARIFDFGTAKVAEPTGTRALVRVDGFEAASLGLRYVTLGTAEGMIRSAGAPEVTGRILLGEASFGRDFEYEVAWQKW